MTIRVIHVDDEQKALDNFKIITEENFPEVELIAQAKSALEAIKLINQLQPDLVFFDISMPNGGGFEILEALQSISFELVFLTAYDNYALKALKKNALDYLLKPIDIDELSSCLEKAKIAISKKSHHAQEIDKFLFRTQSGIEVVQLNNLIRLEADGNYTKAILEENQLYVTKPLKDLEQHLPSSMFIRCHRSHLVNINHVKKYLNKNNGVLELSNGDQISISESKKDELFKLLGAITL